MKAKLLYIVLAFAATSFAVTACNSDDPTEASSKHDYSDGLSPYLRTDMDALVEVSLEFPKARIDEPQAVSLKDYAGKFHTNMNMTVDEVLDGLASGSTVFYTINPNKGIWNLDAPTVNGTGWYWNTAGSLSTADNAVFSVELDKASKSLIVSSLNDPNPGVSSDANVGFAINNGKDLDKYVRFRLKPVVTDPSKIILSVSLPAPADENDYTNVLLSFENYASAIEENLGVSIVEFLSMFDASGTVGEEPLEIYLSNVDGQWYGVDASGNTGWLNPEDVVTRPGSTAGGLGYWLDEELNITTWPTNCFLFIESGDKGVTIGRYPTSKSGEQRMLRFVYTLADDHSRYVEFVIEVTNE